MDKLGIVLDGMKKYHFWVLCGAIVAVGLVGWGWAKDDLADRYDSRERKLSALFNKLEGICGQPQHPNEKVVDSKKNRIDNIQDGLKTKVAKAWKWLKREQDKNNKLAAELSAGFKEEFESFKAGLDDWRNGDDLPSSFRAEYQNFIGQHFDGLFEALGVGSDGDGKDTGIVKWEGHDQIRERFSWSQVPSTAQVVMAQEDLWVYEALFKIIGNTNGLSPESEAEEGAEDTDAEAAGALAYGPVAIKEIVALQIGQDAIAEKASGKGAEGEDNDSGSPGGGADKLKVRPEEAGRYVDADVPPGLLNPGERHPFAEYKIMPIRMQLTIDQMKVPRLLTECANSSMPIEVTRVQFRPCKEESSGEAGSAGAGRGRAARARRKGAVSSNVLKRGETHVSLTIEGVICIYNSPDTNLLGTGAAAEQAAETEPETPAAEPAPETPPAKDQQPEASPEEPKTPASDEAASD